MPTSPTPPKAQPFISVIRGRRPETKAHTNIGHAKNAVGSSGYVGNGIWLHELIGDTFTGRRRYVTGVRGGTVWEQDSESEGGWKLLYDIAPGTYAHLVPWRAQEYEDYVDPNTHLLSLG